MINCVYIHIPFCEKKCKYCSFCSFEGLKLKDVYLDALIKEIKHFYKNEKLETLYFGGGTPSLLNEFDFERLLNCFNISSKTEVTLELNPHLISYQKLKNLKNMGINRFSAGVQSFSDDLLNKIGRLHTKKDVLALFDNFKKANIDNYSIDLMYGLPSQTTEDWILELNYSLGFDIKHISLYGLKIEKGTYFYKFPPKNLPSMDIQANMYETALNILNKKFIHYEFSNFALCEKYYSKHNISYWKRKNYYGFGLSASGFTGNMRYTNTFNFKNYINNPFERNYEILNKEIQIEEEIFLNLRLKEGLDVDYINNKYNIDIYQKYKKEFDKFISLGFMEKEKNIIRLNKKGIVVSNEILCEFINV